VSLVERDARHLNDIIGSEDFIRNPSIPGLELSSGQPSMDSRKRQPESALLTNGKMADRLEHGAELMEAQRANPFRAERIERLPRRTQEMNEQGAHSQKSERIFRESLSKGAV
jgi:hypothetical protein